MRNRPSIPYDFDWTPSESAWDQAVKIVRDYNISNKKPLFQDRDLVIVEAIRLIQKQAADGNNASVNDLKRRDLLKTLNRHYDKLAPKYGFPV